MLQSSAGSFLALAGVLLLIRHELRREERSRQADREKEVEKRAYESLIIFNTETTDLLLGKDKSEEPASELGNYLLKFSFRESPGRNSLNSWISENLKYIGMCKGHEKELLLTRLATATIGGALATWVTRERCRDAYFEPIELVTKVWKNIAKNADVDFADLSDDEEVTHDPA